LLLGDFFEVMARDEVRPLSKLWEVLYGGRPYYDKEQKLWAAFSRRSMGGYGLISSADFRLDISSEDG